MKTIIPPTILITGATDGIGLALAQHYYARGARLCLVGRRDQTTLDPSMFTRETYCRADLAQPYAAAIIAEFLRQQAVKRIDLLIHNAGVGFYGAVETQPLTNIHYLVAVNLYAPIILTHTLLPLIKRARGKLVFISSIIASSPIPTYAVYGATKAALDGFARNLRIELRKRVTVQVIHPGPTRTNIHARSGAPLNQIGWEHFPEPEAVAAKITQHIAHGRRMTTIGFNHQMWRDAGYKLTWLINWMAHRQAIKNAYEEGIDP